MDPHPAKTTPADRRIAREAKSAAMRAKALALHKDGATYAKIGRKIGVCRDRARQIALKAERLAEHPRWFDPLPTRAVNFLHWRGLSELPELEAALAVAKFSRRELMEQPNLGKGALGALIAWLAGHGLALGDETHTENNKGAPAKGRPCDSYSDSSSPLATGHHEATSQCGMPTNQT